MFIHQLVRFQADDIGKDTNIWQFVILLPKANIGANCNIRSNVFYRKRC